MATVAFYSKENGPERHYLDIMTTCEPDDNVITHIITRGRYDLNPFQGIKTHINLLVI